MKRTLHFLSGILLIFSAVTLLAQPQYYNYNTANGTNNSFPFNVNTGKTTQTLYLPGEFAQPTPAPSGDITAVYFQANTGGATTYTQLTIKMGLTTDTDLPTGAWYTGPMTTVLDSANFFYGGGAGEFCKITLQTPFAYDNTKGLVIEVTQCGHSGSGIIIRWTSAPGIKRNAGPLTPGSCPHLWGNQQNYYTHTGLDINTAVGIDPVSGTIPDNYSLEQNYPNPFNPSTDIKFSIPKQGFTTLVVYNILGEVAATLVNQELNAGIYYYNFNAADLPSGVYIYRLTVNDFSETKKLMLLK
jgi:hypothetical protein